MRYRARMRLANDSRESTRPHAPHHVETISVAQVDHTAPTLALAESLQPPISDVAPHARYTAHILVHAAAVLACCEELFAKFVSHVH